MTGRKERLGSQQVQATWACFPFKEAFLQTTPKKTSVSIHWPELCLVPEIAADWLASMEQRRAFPRQIHSRNFQGRNVASSISPVVFYFSFKFKGLCFFFALPLMKSSVFKTFRNIHILIITWENEIKTLSRVRQTQSAVKVRERNGGRNSSPCGQEQEARAGLWKMDCTLILQWWMHDFIHLSKPRMPRGNSNGVSA